MDQERQSTLCDRGTGWEQQELLSDRPVPSPRRDITRDRARQVGLAGVAKARAALEDAMRRAEERAMRHAA